MDYSYFTTAPQSYQFLGLPPTPGHSGSAVSSEDYTRSPTVRAPTFHYASSASSVPHAQDHFTLPRSEDFRQTSSSHYSLSHSYHSPSYPSPSYPSPSYHSPSPHHQSPVHADPHTQAYLTPRGQQQQDGFEQYQNYDFHPQFAAGNANHGLPKSATPPQHKNSLDGPQIYEVNAYHDSGAASAAAADLANGTHGQGQSNSEDDDMTPAQSRRKAQNRAAQRAFRERKERHVKDLEAKLLALESTSASISAENERLKIQLQRASTENEILKATNNPSSSSSAAAAAYSHSPPTTSGPQRYSPTHFYSELLQSHENKTPSHRIVVSEAGERLLAAGAAWDYIISHPLFLRGLVDVGDVSERLKRLAQCDGQGPVFEERAIIRAIELSVASGSDELL